MWQNSNVGEGLRFWCIGIRRMFRDNFGQIRICSCIKLFLLWANGFSERRHRTINRNQANPRKPTIISLFVVNVDTVQSWLDTMAQWKKFCLVTRRLWVQLPPMPLCNNLGQDAYLSSSHGSDSFTKEWQLACNYINYIYINYTALFQVLIC